MDAWLTWTLVIVFFVLAYVVGSVRQALDFVRNPDVTDIKTLNLLTKLKYHKWGWVYSSPETWLKVKSEMDKNKTGEVKKHEKE